MLRLISFVNTPPRVSIPSDRGVTSNKRMSFTLPLRTPPCQKRNKKRGRGKPRNTPQRQQHPLHTSDFAILCAMYNTCRVCTTCHKMLTKKKVTQQKTYTRATCRHIALHHVFANYVLFNRPLVGRRLRGVMRVGKWRIKDCSALRKPGRQGKKRRRVP